MNHVKTGKHGSNDIDPQEVLYLRGDVNYSRIYLRSGHIVVSSRSLKWFADQTPQFVRVHKNALINPTYIRALQLASSIRKTSYVIMRNEVPLAISRRRLPFILEQVGHRHPCSGVGHDYSAAMSPGFPAHQTPSVA